jgi:catechol 2,3-dioxygenase-like lactoylglutathione lyase family enzyme
MDSHICSLVPMAYVRNVSGSIEFYRKLGFEVGNTFVPEGRTEPTWAWLESDCANFMLALAHDAQALRRGRRADRVSVPRSARRVSRQRSGRVTS